MAHQLTTSGLPGEISVDSGILQVAVAYPLPEGAPPEEGAQAIWTVFDAAAALPPECVFHRLTIQVRTDAGVCLQAQVIGNDLRAWHTGQLNDDEFIEEVNYTQKPCSQTSP